MYPLIRLRRVVGRTRTFATGIPPIGGSERNDYVTEGSIKIKHNGKSPAFYNNMQVINRDLSVQVIKLFSETILKERKENPAKKWVRRTDNGDIPVVVSTPTGLTIMDALAATGLRSMRYVDEIPNVQQVIANDLTKQACDFMLEAIEYNNIDKSKISVSNCDAVFAMLQRRNEGLNYDVIDIDPFGSAVPFLDAAVQTVAGDGGLLCITCTDTAVLCGTYTETSLPRYGSVSFKAGYKNEMSLRMLLHAVDSAANKYKRYIVPIVSVSVDFYVRVFVRVYESQAEVKKTLERRLMLYQSTQCPTFHTQYMGTVRPITRDIEGSPPSYTVARLDVPPSPSDGNWKVGGPFWGGVLHDQAFVDTLCSRVEAARVAQSDYTTAATAVANAAAGGATDNVSAESAVINAMAVDSISSATRPTHFIATAERLSGILATISEELKDVPFYYCLTDLSSALQCSTPTMVNVRSGLINAGYKVSRFHNEPDAIKTNAPSDVVWDVMRTHHSQIHGRKFSTEHLRPATRSILAKPTKTKVSFRFAKGAAIETTGPSRYPKNPEKNWGPRSRAKLPPGSDASISSA